MLPIKDDIPTRRLPIVTLLIIAACVVLYFGFERGGLGLGDTGNERVLEYGAIPYEVTRPGKECFLPPAGSSAEALARAAGQQVLCEGQQLEVTDQLGAKRTVQVPDELPRGAVEQDAPTWLTLLSSMFLHGGLLHLAFNMLFLWIFGNNIEDSMGRVKFVAFYLLGGLAALLAQVAIDPGAAVPTVGASGAIAAVLGGYAVLYPRARVLTVIFIIPFFTVAALPALLVLGLWFGLQLLLGLSDVLQPLGREGGVAYFAHIGGFLFGLALIKLFADRVKEDYMTHRRLPVY